MKKIEAVRWAQCSLLVGILLGGAIWSGTVTADKKDNQVFEIIVTTGTQFIAVGNPTISDNGVVAFVGTTASGGKVLAYWDDGVISIAADDSYSGITQPSLNASGTLAFQALGPNTGRAGNYIWNPGDEGPTLLYSSLPNSQFFALGPPTLRPDSSTIVFVAIPRIGNGRGVYEGDGTGPAATVVFAGPIIGSITADLVSVNSSAEFDYVAFQGLFLTGDKINMVRELDQGDPGADFLFPVATTVGNATYLDIGAPSINTLGTMLFRVSEASSSSVILAEPGGELVVFASTSANGFESINSDPSLNDDNDVVFSADLQNGETGIYDGPNWKKDRLVQTGDKFFDGTLMGVQTFFEAVNNKREVVFFYTLTDGTSGIAITTLP